MSNSFVNLIDLNTFASIWYWALAVVAWAGASHWLIGVPFDVLYFARSGKAESVQDLEALVSVNVRRIMFFQGMAGMLFTGLISFLLTAMLVAGFYYGIELGRGMFVLAAPLTLIMAINVRLAQELHNAPLTGEALVKRMFAVRLRTQVIGMIAIFGTAVYGSYSVLMAEVFI